jgi:hypothetical protein
MAPLGFGVNWNWLLFGGRRLYRILVLIGRRAVWCVLDSPANGGEESSAVRAAAIWRKVFVAFALTVTSDANSIVAPS